MTKLTNSAGMTGESYDGSTTPFLADKHRYKMQQVCGTFSSQQHLVSTSVLQTHAWLWILEGEEELGEAGLIHLAKSERKSERGSFSFMYDFNFCDFLLSQIVCSFYKLYLQLCITHTTNIHMHKMNYFIRAPRYISISPWLQSEHLRHIYLMTSTNNVPLCMFGCLDSTFHFNISTLHHNSS